MRTEFWKWLIASIAVAGCSSACGREGSLTRAIAAAAVQGPGTRVVLEEHTEFRWDSVCILGPYTPDSTVEALTGIQGAAGRAHDIRSRDEINVLMFIRDGRIVLSAAQARSQGDFGPELVGKCYTPEEADFSVRVPPRDSWGNIGPR